MNLNLNRKKREKEKKGFAMLFAVLTASLLVTIGVSIFSISLKELMISASIRDSQTANYASESAYECFKYWQLFDKGDLRAFSPVTPTLVGTSTVDRLKTESSSATIVCNGRNIIVDLNKDPGVYTYRYDSGTSPFFKYSSSTSSTEPEASFSFVIEASECVEGSREVCTDTNAQSTYHSTSTFSGYNTSASGRRVERKYEIVE